jgi:fructose-bisphosphate aldolase class I
MAGDHSLDRCEIVTATVLESVFSELFKERVFLEGVLLKPNMVIPGADYPNKASVAQVAEATIRCLNRSVPAAIPGIVFLSGGQSPELATRHLNAMNATKNHPWELSFSYGRALQEPVLYAWKGNAANVSEAQDAFYHRATCNHTARYGNYSRIMEVR